MNRNQQPSIKMRVRLAALAVSVVTSVVCIALAFAPEFESYAGLLIACGGIAGATGAVVGFRMALRGE